MEVEAPVMANILGGGVLFKLTRSTILERLSFFSYYMEFIFSSISDFVKKIKLKIKAIGYVLLSDVTFDL